MLLTEARTSGGVHASRTDKKRNLSGAKMRLVDACEIDKAKKSVLLLTMMTKSMLQ